MIPSVVAALNGLVGDHLAAIDHPLALAMTFRHDGKVLPLERFALRAQLRGASARVLVLLHDVCMNDLQWQRDGNDHGAALARELGFTPVYLHYNSGLHVSDNGARLAELLQALRDVWPVPLQRLVLLGMPTALIQQVERNGQVQAVSTVHAPTGGLVQELMVRPGMTVSQGMSLARITGLSTVWVEAALPETQATAARMGQPVEVVLAAFPGATLPGKITSILPEANAETRTLRVRAELPNPQGRLRAGMFAQMRLGGSAEEALVMPAEAVIRTGQRAVVYVVEQPGRFTPVEVRLGRELGDRLEVLGGLQPGQQVVASGQFLIDSEASMQGVLARRASPAASATGAAAAPMPAPAVHEASGRIVEISAQAVTIHHGAVPALQWPPMEMGFALAQPALAKDIKVGDTVRFSFRESKEGHEVVALKREPQGGAR